MTPWPAIIFWQPRRNFKDNCIPCLPQISSSISSVNELGSLHAPMRVFGHSKCTCGGHLGSFLLGSPRDASGRALPFACFRVVSMRTAGRNGGICPRFSLPEFLDCHFFWRAIVFSNPGLESLIGAKDNLFFHFSGCPSTGIRILRRLTSPWLSRCEERMPEFDTPEVQRTSMARLFLRAKKLSQARSHDARVGLVVWSLDFLLGGAGWFGFCNKMGPNNLGWSWMVWTLVFPSPGP